MCNRFHLLLKISWQVLAEDFTAALFESIKISFSLSDRLRKLSEQVAAFWYRLCLISPYSGHSVRTCSSSSTLFAQLKHNLCSLGSLSYRPVFIRSGATPHLNLASALRCCLFNTSVTPRSPFRYFYKSVLVSFNAFWSISANCDTEANESLFTFSNLRRILQTSYD